MKKVVTIEFHASKGSSEPVKADIELDLVEMPDYSQLADGSYKVDIAGGVASWTAFESLPDHTGLADGNYQLNIVGGVPTWTLIV